MTNGFKERGVAALSCSVLLLMAAFLNAGGVYSWQSFAPGAGHANMGTWTTCSTVTAFFITPRTFNTNSANDGNSITVHFIGGLPGGFTNQNVQLIQMRVVPDNGRAINALPHPANESSGVVKFTSNDLVFLLNGMTGDVTLEVSGAANGCDFVGTDTISVISPGGGRQAEQDDEQELMPGDDEGLLEGDQPLVPDEQLDAGDPADERDEESGAGDDGDPGSEPEGDAPETNDPDLPPPGDDGDQQQEDLDDANAGHDEDAADEQDDADVDPPGMPDVQEIDEGDSSTPEQGAEEGGQSGSSDSDTSIEDDQQADNGDEGDQGPPKTEPRTPAPWVLPRDTGDEHTSDEPDEHEAPEQPGDPSGSDSPEPPLGPSDPDESGQPDDPVDSPGQDGDSSDDADLPDLDNGQDDGTSPDDESDAGSGGPDEQPTSPDDPEDTTDDGGQTVTEPGEGDAGVEEPIVVCPVELAVNFHLDELDLADADADLRIRIEPENSEDAVSIDDIDELDVLVKLGPDRYDTTTVVARPASGHGPGVFRIASDDLRELLDEHRGKVTLEVRAVAGDCDAYGSEQIVVIETIPEPEEPAGDDPDDVQDNIDLDQPGGDGGSQGAVVTEDDGDEMDMQPDADDSPGDIVKDDVDLPDEIAEDPVEQE